MSMPRFFAPALASLLGLALLASFSRAAAPASPRLELSPSTLDLAGPEHRHGLLVTAIVRDGSVSDVTAQVAYQSRDPRIVEVAAPGSLVGRAAGKTTIAVSYKGLAAILPVQVGTSAPKTAPSFLNDVMPLFTRLGCNQGACHGKNVGQNGFRLSLRGYAPEWDYLWVTREYSGRRINAAVPEASLLLRKPLGLAPHGGGKVIRAGSREHGTLSSWIRAGAPGPMKNETEVRRLEVLPGRRTLRPGQEQQLLVRAQYSDGRWRDATWLAQLAVNDGAVAEVSPAGKLRILRPGETAVRASFMGQVAVMIATVPNEKPVAAELLTHRNSFIDEHVFAKLGEMRIEPADICSDSALIRRAFLDTIGSLPSPEEARAFLADGRADKRGRLVDRLLDRPEFVDYWALQLADLLQNRKERDHDVRGTKGVRSFHQWLRKQVAANRPWNELARDILTATGKSTENPAVGYYIVTVGENREADRSEVVASVAQAFLGTRIGCAQCHNHPLEKYTQDDYYHFAAYFSRIRLDRKDPRQGPTVLAVSLPDPNQNKNPVGVTQPRTGMFMKPQPLDRSVSSVLPGDDPRAKLASWITDPKNEYFAGAMVNRLWRHYLGVGLVEPVDDLRASNPPTNPELWKALNREFVSKKYDLKHMMRLILKSRTYQLSSTTTPGNEKETRFYSHYYARRLPAEVLLDALAVSTGVPNTFEGYPVGVRAVQLPDPQLKSYFLTLFGRSLRVTACACERNGEVTLAQLLHLQNGDSVVQKIRAPAGRLGSLLKKKKSDAAVVADLFLATLSRMPKEAEMAAVQESLAEGDSREEVFRDLFWALLNTKEFAFNH
jgi:hypothetical protein